ncbi:MAG: RtcB family protein [Gemmatimonadota bacterium]
MDQPTTTAPPPSAIADALVRSGPVSVDVPTAFRSDMRVPVRIYADDELLRAIVEGDAITQLVNVATIPGIVDFAYGMPDMHEGYGFPVGGVAATLLPDGVVSPGGVGFDINCGVRLLATPLTREELGGRHTTLTHEISRSIPAGTGRGGRDELDNRDLDRVLAEGAGYVVRQMHYGLPDDLLHAESGGCLPEADPSAVSQRAKDRGRTQLGTLGAGNHFVELQQVDEVFDPVVAERFGLRRGQITVLIHTGSRGLGHQVCTDYVRLFDARLAEYGIVIPDRQLSCAPASSPDGARYFAAMSAAANFAWANRQTIGHRIRDAVCRMFPHIAADDVRVVYDVAHNIVKRETHAGRSLCVHRKGATRAFGPGHDELPAAYRDIGQPVFIPGSMGTASFVLVGTSEAEQRSFGSACHGAGRALSRGAAKRQVSGAAVRAELEHRGIAVRSPSAVGLAEEAPIAYKDVERVTEVVERAGLARRVARLTPIGVVKG